MDCGNIVRYIHVRQAVAMKKKKVEKLNVKCIVSKLLYYYFSHDVMIVLWE